jgi:hypothetical protein
VKEVFEMIPPATQTGSRIMMAMTARMVGLALLFGSMAFNIGQASFEISVREVSVLPAASFRFHLTMGTFAVRLTIPHARFVCDFHPLVNAPCRARKREARFTGEAGFSFFES